MVDTLLRNGTIYPGDAEPRDGDVAISDGLMVAVGPGLELEADRTIDLQGLALAPGFVDMHAHSALRSFTDPSLEPKVRQGFTTELINPDGLGPAPVAPERWQERRTQLIGLEGPGPPEWQWESIEDYLADLETTGPATSLCPLVPHGAVRDLVMGGERRPATSDELQAMRHQVARGMEAGAWGVSFGLIYTPAAYSTTEELIAVALEARRHGGLLVAHVRGESHNLLEAVGEMIDVSRQSGAALHISHLKVLGPRNVGKLERLLELVDEAAGEGLDITFDQYPYGAAATVLSALLPPWAHEGGANDTLARLRDAGFHDRLARDLQDPGSGPENFYFHCGPDSIVVTDCGTSGPVDAVGGSIAEIAADRGVAPTQAVIDLLVETELQASMLVHYAEEATVTAITQHPLMLVGTDAIFAAKPHPRLWGTVPRFLGRYAIRDGLITLREAVARLSIRAAHRIGLHDRGAIAEGLRADLVAFDPPATIDDAWYDEPTRPARGIEWVIVGGEVTVDPEGLTGSRGGQVARRPVGHSR